MADVDVYLGLGSNIGDRAANLWEVARRLGALPNSRLVALSSLFETEPVGPIPQRWFVNAALRMETALQALELLRAAQAIEQELGRSPTPRWGPRRIDVDLLLYGDLQLFSQELVVPHPELWNRRFVLVPLRQVLSSGETARRVDARLVELGDRPSVIPLGRSGL